MLAQQDPAQKSVDIPLTESVESSRKRFSHCDVAVRNHRHNVFCFWKKLCDQSPVI